MYHQLSKLAPTLLYTAIAGSFIVAVSNTQAQRLEETLVTAQKRLESLQDVPISIATISGEKLTESNIFKIEDLQTFIPNLSLTETGLSTQIYIRGIGTGTNPGFEQSVGTYVDGIHYGRSQLLRMPFLDLQRIEVLRGPQSILFGKNSIAGALSLTTAAPTEELEGEISVNYTPDSDMTELTGVISGPMSENLSGRLAVRKYDEDGWMDNTFINKSELARDETAIRLALQWDATDNLRVGFKAQRSEFNAEGRQIETIKDDPAIAGPFSGLTYSQILASAGYPGAITETRQNNKRQSLDGESSDNEVENYVLTIDYQLGDLALTAISGFISYEYTEGTEGSLVGAPLFRGVTSEEYDQFSQEIRLASPGGESVDWIAGVFYQTSDLGYDQNLIFPGDSALGVLLPPSGPILGTEAVRNYTSDADTWALFGQATWNVSDTLRLTIGGRYTSDEKSAFREVNIVDSATGTITENPVSPIVWWALGISSEQFDGHSLSDSRDEGVFTPLINAQWDATDDVMLYASYSTGFKSGGFDATANSPAFFEFEEEKATTYEIGAKSTFLDGAAELNVALYRTEYDDLQTSQYDGGLGFTVGNAKETVVQGVELDGRWAFTDSLTMGYGMAYLDHEYKDFTNGNCYNGQVPDGDVVNGIPLCDFSGKSGTYTPELMGNLSFSHVMNLTPELTLQSNFDLSYRDEQNVHVNLDPNGEVGSITKMDFRIALQAQNWELALLVQNLSDEQTFSLIGDTPLASTFGPSTFYGFVTRPRTTYLQAKYRF
jgi:iron complex outermembrane receptor protein